MTDMDYLKKKINSIGLSDEEKQAILTNINTLGTLSTNQIDTLIQRLNSDVVFKESFLKNPRDALSTLDKIEAPMGAGKS